MIDKSKTYRTRDGREVRIYATDGRGEWPVHGAVGNEDGWHIVSWRSDGKWTHGHSTADLIEVKPRIKREVWVNVYQNGATAHVSDMSALANQCESCLACVKLTIDCEEGEGL